MSTPHSLPQIPLSHPSRSHNTRFSSLMEDFSLLFAKSLVLNESGEPQDGQHEKQVLDQVLSFVTEHKDRNSVSLVCKSWYGVERWSRRSVFVGNCYAVSPETVIRRFPKLRSVTLKGKPHFADFNLVPEGWGGYVYLWIVAMAEAYPGLEELRLKRMVVTDECLELIALKFKDLKVLVLTSCEGFSTDGLSAIASNCRKLTELDLHECEVEDLQGDWLSLLAENCTSLVSLKFACLDGEVNFSALECLLIRCTNLRTLRVNQSIPLEKLPDILFCAPQLVDLGTGSFSSDDCPELYSQLACAFAGCKGLERLSGFWEVTPSYLPAVYSVCGGITALNLSYANIPSHDLIALVSQCQNLEKLWVLDHIEDTGLEAVAASCKKLHELRVFPSHPFDVDESVVLTEKGLISVSEGCSKLQSVLYFCRQMSNVALITIAKNRPNLTHFRLCIIDPQTPDYSTLQPLDTGFGAIVKHCKDLKRLSLSGLLTDRVFEYIGSHAKKLEMLSVAFVGDSDLGLHHVLSGCPSLRKLEIRDCPFGDEALLANAMKLETMRSLWMSSCLVSYGACKLLGQKMQKLNVEVIDERGSPDARPDDCHVERLYVYRTLAGPRDDVPEFVFTMRENSS